MQLPEYITNLLDGIAVKEGFSNYRFETESGSEHGENFLGQMTAIKLIGDRVKCGETLYLMCKIAPQNKQQRDAFSVLRAFEREVFLYTRVLPMFVEFQREKGLVADESFLSFPKVYATVADKKNDRYALIMEDLRANNFAMLHGRDSVTLEHEKLIMMQLGRFHGISYALKDQRPEIYAEFKAIDDVVIHMMENGQASIMFRHSIERAIEFSENENHRKVLENLLENYSEIYKSSFSKKFTEKWGIINHGDCWINNFLFEHDEKTTKPKAVCLIDWQMTKYCSPAVDLIYHFFTSTSKQLRDQSYQELLRIYHSSLRDIVRKLGTDPDKVFQFSDLLDELKANGKYGLTMGLAMRPFVHAEQGDVIDLEYYSVQIANGKPVPLFKTRNAGYIRAINDIVGDAIDYGYCEV